MVRKPPSLASLAIVGGLLIAFVVWTTLTFNWPPITAMDRATLAEPMLANSARAQICAAFALLTWPGLIYGAVLGLAIWAGRHRLRQLSVALVLTVVLTWGGATLLKFALGRTRPELALDLITANGYSYPSGHLSAATAAVVAVGATFAVTRQSDRAKIGWQAGGAAIILAVGANRWALGAHYLSDLIGAVLFGALAASAALLIAGVSALPHTPLQELITARTSVPPEPGTKQKRCAVIYNPAKVTDWVTFRRHVEYELRTRGWARAIWLETTEDDPGTKMTETAVSERVDLVIGAGGDGTIRAICAGLASTGIPFGLVPAGTGNLLARNLGIPLDEGAALDVAFDGLEKPIDLVKLTVDDGKSDRFAVMAGIGLDAVIMQSTNPDLKKAVGSAAYFVSAAQNANHPALHATIQVDDEPPLRRRAHLIVVGNVGYLQANIPLIPAAKPDDGLLDVLVASPRSPADWVKLTAKVLTRRKGEDEQLDRLTGRKVTITVEEGDQYQLDGDTVGTCSSMVAEVEPGALLLRVPRSPGSGTSES